MERDVHYKTKIGILKNNPNLTFITLMTTVLPVVMLSFFIGVFVVADKWMPNLDYENVFQNGESLIGEIIRIEKDTNSTINGKHPSIVKYKFTYNAVEKQSKVNTLDSDNFSNMGVNAKVNVIYFQNESIIRGLKPSNFQHIFVWFLSAP